VPIKPLIPDLSQRLQKKIKNRMLRREQRERDQQ
jgi:hypothetical protein